MAANRFFIVCQHHATIDQALCLAEREDWDTPYVPGSSPLAKAWFEKHRNCGRGNTMDHFRLAMHRPADHDKPVLSVGAGVRLALVKNEIDRIASIPPDSKEENSNG